MKNAEFVSRVSSQLKLLTKDDYHSDRLILSTGETIARKFITQKIARRSIDRDASLFKEIKCIEFVPENVFKCSHIEFRSCEALSKSKKSLKDIGLIFTRYGSTIKQLHSIDRNSTTFTESTLYQLNIDSQRAGGEEFKNKFYIIDDHIYIPRKVKQLSALILATDQYELDELCDCEESCESAWEKDFICPDSMLDDVISYTLQHMAQSKQIPEDENPNLSNNN